MTDMIFSERRLKEICGRAAERAEQWMLEHLKSMYKGNTPDDPMKYYKWPLALEERGRRDDARQLLRWIGQKCMTQSGDILSARSGFHDEFHTYANLWLVLAAIRLGEKQFLERALDFLLKWHNKNRGGLITNPHVAETDLTEDPLSTSFLGWAACDLGDEDLASSALDYLRKWFDQTVDNGRLWLRTSPDGALICHVPAGADPSIYVIELGKLNESYYFLGSICFFLANYIKAFGRGGALEMAEKIACLLEDIGTRPLHTIWAAKVAPGCVALYNVTSGQRFLDIAKPVIQAVLKGQSPEGYWLKNNQPWITISAEQCYWLSVISELLS